MVQFQPLDKGWQPAVVCPQALQEPVRLPGEDVCVSWEPTHQVDAVHDADAEGHEGFREVNDLLTLCGDGEARDCEVRFLKRRGHIHTYTECSREDVTQVYDITNHLSA